MRADERRSPPELLAAQQRRRLPGKGGKRGEPAEKAGGDQQTRFRRQRLEVRQHGKRDAHQIAADQVGGERAERQRRKHGIENDAEPPAQPGARGGAASDSQQAENVHFRTEYRLPCRRTCRPASSRPALPRRPCPPSAWARRPSPPRASPPAPAASPRPRPAPPSSITRPG